MPPSIPVLIEIIPTHEWQFDLEMVKVPSQYLLVVESAAFSTSSSCSFMPD